VSGWSTLARSIERYIGNASWVAVDTRGPRTPGRPHCRR
jgi:hypothetical protein